MKIRICDKCRNRLDRTSGIVHCRHEFNDISKDGVVNWIMGREYEVDLCWDCFKEFMNFTP